MCVLGVPSSMYSHLTPAVLGQGSGSPARLMRMKCLLKMNEWSHLSESTTGLCTESLWLSLIGSDSTLVNTEVMIVLQVTRRFMSIHMAKLHQSIQGGKNIFLTEFTAAHQKSTNWDDITSNSKGSSFCNSKTTTGPTTTGKKEEKVNASELISFNFMT